MPRAKDNYRFVGHMPLEVTPSYLELRKTAAELRDKGDEVVSLDLHGKDIYDAREMIINFISNQIKAGNKDCRIIHGKGTGALHKTAQQVLENFKQQGVIINYFDSQHSKYQGAAIMVMLKENPLE